MAENVKRAMVKRAIGHFGNEFAKVLKDSKEHSERRKGASLHMEAAMILKKQLKWVNSTAKRIGDVPGVFIGDAFQWRAELMVVGLHCQPTGGIDYIVENGEKMATSLVGSGCYSNRFESLNVIEYCGQGGNLLFDAKKKIGDQKLERGNLALQNSMKAKKPVRVIWKFENSTRFNEMSDYGRSGLDYKFVYCGLYTVKCCKKDRGASGKLVFKFLLVRKSDQPSLFFNIERGQHPTSAN